MMPLMPDGPERRALAAETLPVPVPTGAMFGESCGGGTGLRITPWGVE
jgi:hypothetical protein